jgi:hypothetical protein
VSDGPVALAAGASTVLTPKAISTFWACAKFENTASEMQVKDKRAAVRNVCFKRTSHSILI